MQLSPMIDIVFKMLFSNQDSEQELVSLLNAVIKPKEPIISAKVLNPNIPKEFFEEHGVVVDILAELSDGTKVDIEMQSSNNRDLIKRTHYYGAKMLATSLGAGESYGKLKPAIVIFFLGENFFHTECQSYHLSFSMHEDNNKAAMERLLSFHFVEIPKLIQYFKIHKQELGKDSLVDWGRFLYNPYESALKEVFMQDSAIKKAKDRLDSLANDPEAREIARVREIAMRRYKGDVDLAREEGRKEARKEIVKKLIALSHIHGYSDEDIAKIADISGDEIKAIKDSLKDQTS